MQTTSEFKPKHKSNENWKDNTSQIITYKYEDI